MKPRSGEWSLVSRGVQVAEGESLCNEPRRTGMLAFEALVVRDVNVAEGAPYVSEPRRTGTFALQRLEEDSAWAASSLAFRFLLRVPKTSLILQ
jgi:hypothetical protein